MRLPVSVCIISKNEAKHIGSCLERLVPFFDDIVLTDTGSEDGTVRIASHYTRRIYTFPWKQDFSAARNYAAGLAINDWVISVDCDEYLESIDLNFFMEISSCPPHSLGMLSLRSPYLTMGSQAVRTEKLARIFSKSHYRFDGSIHEQLVPSGSFCASYFEAPVAFLHLGYTDETTLSKKAMRNMELLTASLQSGREDPYTYFQLGQCCMALKDYSKACQYFEVGLSFDADPRQEYIRNMVESYGYCLLELKEFKKALQFVNLYNTFSDRSDFVFLMGLIFMNNAYFEEAIQEFKNAVSLKNAAVQGADSYMAWYNTGVIYECTGNLSDAKKYYALCGKYQPALTRLKSMDLEHT